MMEGECTCANHMMLWVAIRHLKSSTVGAFTWSSLRWFQSVVVRTKKRALVMFRVRQDQEEVGELDSHEEASPEEVKSMEVVLD